MGMFSDIIDGLRDVFRHLANADMTMLAVVAAVIVLIGYFLLKR